MSLVQAGKLDLDTDVNQYLKSWKLPANEFTKEARVTPRGLLSHTAGVTVHGFAGYEAGATVPTLTQVLDGNLLQTMAPFAWTARQARTGDIPAVAT